jgi:hypothetical protein
MDIIEKDIELGIIQGKSIKWIEPHFDIRGASVTIEIPINKYIKWIKQQKRTHKHSKFLKGRTIETLDEFYIVNWAWIE